jgi:nucleoside-diphosphate-sugar epimerase
MRIVVLGGTRFIGRAIVAELASHGHTLLVAHRGETEPEDFPEVAHLHCLRKELPDHAKEIAAFHPEAVVDTIAMSRASSRIALDAVPGALPRVVLSSVDVYRAYDGLRQNVETDPVPLTEESAVREVRFPYKGQIPGMDEYEKLDVEEEYLGAGGTVLRLPMVYGPHDGQRREEFVLRRVRAGRARIPVGSGNWISSRAFAPDIAVAARLAIENDAARGEIFNVAEQSSPTEVQWAREILAAAGSDAELVRVPDEVLPEDLGTTGALAQHFQFDSCKARTVLGWRESARAQTVKASVDWHLANPPAESSEDFDADDAALAKAIEPAASPGLGA